MATLTQRQSEIFEFLKQRIGSGLPPTVREIGDRFGIRSPNGVMCHLRALEKKRLIERNEMTSRGIRLVGGNDHVPQWRDRPVVEGWYLNSDLVARHYSGEEIQQMPEIDYFKGRCFGPVPADTAGQN